VNPNGWLAGHRRLVVLGALMAALAGLVAALHLPVSLFPHVDFPRIAISADSGDRDVELTVTQVTMPLEEAVRAVPGVRSVRSRSSRGSSELSIDFAWGQDMVTALLQVQTMLAEATPRLPKGTQLFTRRLDPTVFPALGYSLTSKTRTLGELGDIATFQVRPQLLRVTGVAKVGIQGAPTEELRVTVDPDRLAALGLTPNDVGNAIAQANALQSLGRLEDHGKLYIVLATNTTRTLAAINDLVVRAGPNGVTRLQDVAHVGRASAPQKIRVTADGHDAVLLQVYQQPFSNVVQIAADATAEIAQLQKTLPPDVKLAIWYDQSQLVANSAASLRDAVLIGTALAALVLLIFLRNLPVTLLAGLVVPAVLATTCLLLQVLGQSFNIMTLGGMAAAVGLIIDDVIVMVEHIERRLRADPDVQKNQRFPALHVAREFTRPLVGASLATILIHVPPAFMTGVTGEFFRALSLTMAVSLIVSFFVAWLVVPVLANVLDLGLSRDAAPQQTDVLTRAYVWLLTRALRWRWSALLVIALLVASGALLYPKLASGFMPPMDEGGFVLDYRSPPGTGLAQTDAYLRTVEGILRETPEVASYSRRTGLQLGGGLTEANEGDFFIRLKPQPRRDAETVMAELRVKIERDVPTLRIEMMQLMEDLIGDLTGVPQPIEVKLASEDPQALRDVATRVAAALRQIPGIVEVNDGLLISGDALEVHVDTDVAALHGLDAAGVDAALGQAFAGNIAAEVKRDDLPKMLGIRLWTPGESRDRVEDLGQLRVTAPDGHVVAADRLARVTAITGQPQIGRENLRRIVAVTGRTEGIDLGLAVQRVKAVLADERLRTPPGGGRPLPFELGGLYAQQQQAFRSLAQVFLAAIVLLFLLLLWWFDRVRIAGLVVLTALLALPGVVIGLWLTGTELDISSLMGLTMIVGSVTEVSLFLVSAVRELPTELPLQERVAQAAASRLRPIAMTTIAAILAMLPLALGVGEGAAMLTPLAIAIIAGLVVQLPLVLFLLPQGLVLLRAE
jgi:multidrug efflux pump subunit AcrB